MPKLICEKPDCTVAETGKCLLLHEPADKCPNVRSEETFPEPEAVPVEPLHSEAEPSMAEKGGLRHFHSGFELGTQDAAKIMFANYAHLIGVLGFHNAGKTCFLSSLYLMAAHGLLRPKYLFSGSLSLQGFEHRAKRLRQWEEGVLPDKLADHTQLRDHRRPSLVHLSIRATGGEGTLLHLLFTDLPGEWSKDLVEGAGNASRFGFLHRADGIIVVIDGTRLASEFTRHSELHRSRLLLGRLAENVNVDRTIPIVLMLSKCDLLDMKAPKEIYELERFAIGLGFSADVVLTAAFSSKPAEVQNGTGVWEAIENILVKSANAGRREDVLSDSSQPRCFLRFRWQQ